MSAPARLLSVRLQGFKSFVDRTHVEFGPGISAVVGPNGSGKSNLADALRWALGEQGRALRSRKSEDVIWAGSERRPAVGMADVQLTLDNTDALLPVEYGVVELGRRLYRSGENDYLLNRQRVRLKDLVDLLDAGHLAENAFLFIGQGMVDQALALRPEERRPLFEEVAGVRRHERRRRRAEEQLAESESNLARVDDILGELRPQARRLAQQAEQQANRLTAADELAVALLLSAHHRWYAAAGRAAATSKAVGEARAALESAMASLQGHERAMAAAGEALGSHAAAESAARIELDRLRADRAALQLREGRVTSDLEGAARERARLAEARSGAEAEATAARDVLAEPAPASAADLEEELAGIDADLAAMAAGAGAAPVSATLSAGDAAAIRRLEAARVEEHAAARRRAADADRRATEESERAAAAAARAEAAAGERAEAAAALAGAEAAERAAREGRERAQQHVTEAEGVARAAAEAAAGARATAAALAARLADAQRALEAAEGSGFSKAARARGGRSISDGLIVDPALQAAVDAALAGLSRAHVVARGDIASLSAERGVAIARESVETTARPGGRANDAERIVEQARAHGGGALREAIRRDDAGGATALLTRAVWVPDAAACLELQPLLPPGWVAVARDGGLVAGEVATWVRPEGRGLHLRADADRLADETTAAVASADAARAAAVAADDAVAAARVALGAARQREGEVGAATRRAAELDRAATAKAETTGRDAAWLVAQAARLQAESARLRAAIPAEPEARNVAPSPESGEAGESGTSSTADAAATDRRRADLRDRRAAVATDVDRARSARAAYERRRAQAEAGSALAERQLAATARAAAELAEREARLALDREDIHAALTEANRRVATAEANLATVARGSEEERARLRSAEAAAATGREQARITGERARLAERDEVEARLALEGLREQVIVELAALGAPALVHLLRSGAAPATAEAPASPTEAETDVEPDALEAALTAATPAWESTEPEAPAPSPNRLATLRRRFHDLGAVNPFAADEYAEVRARLELLDGQRTDLQSAIDATRALIAELDKLVTDQFRRTFEALERAFDARFQQLFGGGYARLTLTDPQDLTTTGVEITARPPGKKAQALSMLSGGERALTAVALLFAMLTVRPVPFCVLDEVDAALDEANVGRFTDALRELAQQTQCIVITHNRGTIEAADALYGVTVGDDSASRVISLRLDEATAIAGRSRGGGGAQAAPTLATAMSDG
ncbi:MAG TPA: chromosome segregation protein SMC [Candidatus Limnocylindrales bacterium]|nr:chromosome segregation protein SMC [Candidatus Limnocylindrales bacterium]